MIAVVEECHPFIVAYWVCRQVHRHRCCAREGIWLNLRIAIKSNRGQAVTLRERRIADAFHAGREGDRCQICTTVEGPNADGLQAVTDGDRCQI